MNENPVSRITTYARVHQPDNNVINKIIYFTGWVTGRVLGSLASEKPSFLGCQ